MFNVEYEGKLLSLVKYALEKKGVVEGEYVIGNYGDELAHTDKICLLKSLSGEWSVLYTERGQVSGKSLHSDINNAVTDFYWRLTRRDTPWDYRSEWEMETGQAF